MVDVSALDEAGELISSGAWDVLIIGLFIIISMPVILPLLNGEIKKSFKVIVVVFLSIICIAGVVFLPIGVKLLINVWRGKDVESREGC